MQYLPAGSQQVRLIEILEQESTSQVPLISRLLKGRPIVIKDVHICLAVEYIWEQIKPFTIILIRHPCGMASSWKKLNIKVRFRLELLLSQENLMADHLAPFETHMREERDWWFDIGVYWGASLYVMERLSHNHPEWQWVTHEELCVNSAAQYQRLLLHLGVSIDQRGRRKLETFIYQHDRKRLRRKPYSVSRLSANEPGKWRGTLAPEQISAVIDGAEPFGILEKYYLDH